VQGKDFGVRFVILQQCKHSWRILRVFIAGLYLQVDLICGLEVLEFLATDPEVTGSIPDPTRFSEK
jgi:hypothetical protein